MDNIISNNSIKSINTDTLKGDQAPAMEKLANWLTTNEPMFMLSGAAGTGKTWLVSLLLDNVINYEVKGTAPTNTAACNLREKCGIASDDSRFDSFGTIHSLLKLKLTTEEEVEVADKCTVESFTIVYIPIPGNPIQPPYVIANLVADGSNISFIHLLSECDNESVRRGQRVQAVWKPEEE